MTDDESSLTGRLSRYARVGVAMGGLAARVAGGRVTGRGRSTADSLRAALGGLKGPLMKAGQFLATIPDLLPPEYAEELQKLQADAPPMGWAFVRRRMASELGADWEGRFASFDRQASAAASLGQVHKAHGHDGRLLACKLQYPDMASAVEADLDQLGVILRLLEGFDGAIATGQIKGEIAARLREELDYEREAKHARLYRAILDGVAGVHVPEVVGELSTKRLLTLEWLDGQRILDAVADRPDARDELALNMFRAWYIPFYEYGVIHGDPHLGNYSVRPDNTVNLFDFGCIRVFPPRFVHGVIELYFALQADDRERAIEAYRSWGFTDPKPELVDVLNLWARFLYAPLLEDRPRSLKEERMTYEGARTANKVHAELRRLGGVEIPREFVFMDRAAVGLGSLFHRLGAEVNWYRVFHGLIDGFDVDALAKRQADALAAVGLEAP